MSEYIIKGETLTGIADAIRSKDGTTEPIPAGSMAERVMAMKVSDGSAEAMLAGIIIGDIESVSSPVTKISDYAFSSKKKLKDVSFPNAVSIGEYAFNHCDLLANVVIPCATSIGSYAFGYCYWLVKAVFRELKSAGNACFYNCSRLEYVDMGMVAAVPGSCFYSSSKLKTLILRRTGGITALNTTNAMTSTAIAKGNGYIYVPAALLDTYKAATNWSTYAAQFRALEDYTVDGTVTGELDSTKI